MAEPVYLNDPDQANQVLTNEYYQKLQRDIRERREAQQVARHGSGEGGIVEDHHRVNQVAVAAKSSESKSPGGFNDSVQIRSFRWDRSRSGDFTLTTDQADPLLTTVDLKGKHIESMSQIGYKIDYSDRLGQMRQALMQSVVQSRSGNYFVSKYAEFKVGVLVRLLGLLGVAPAELTAMQHQAIEDAIIENIQLMGENIYSLELTELVFGNSKKAKRNVKMFKEVQSQLIGQMKRLGRSDYWSATRIAEEHIRQVGKIKEEFEKERDDLSYQYDYYFRMMNGQ